MKLISIEDGILKEVDLSYGVPVYMPINSIFYIDKYKQILFSEMIDMDDNSIIDFDDLSILIEVV